MIQNIQTVPYFGHCSHQIARQTCSSCFGTGQQRVVDCHCGHVRSSVCSTCAGRGTVPVPLPYNYWQTLPMICPVPVRLKMTPLSIHLR